MAIDNYCRFKGEVTNVSIGLTERKIHYVLFTLKLKNNISNDGKQHYQILTCKRFSVEPINIEGLEKGCYVDVEGSLRTEYKKSNGSDQMTEKKFLQWTDIEVLASPHENANTPQKTIVVDITGQNGQQNIQQPSPPKKTPERRVQKGDAPPFDDYTFPDEAPF